MKKLYLSPTVLCCALLFFTANLTAQDWSQLGPLIESFNQGERDNYDVELDDLSDRLLNGNYDGLKLSDIQLGPSIDSLFSYLNGGGIGIPDSFQNVWAGNRDALDDFLNNGLYGETDSLALIGQFDDINNIWYDELDSLRNVINGGGPNITDDLLNNGDNRFRANGGNWERAFQRLQNENEDFLDGFDPQGPDSLIEILDTTLFAGNLDIEMAFGQEWAQVGFYGEQYSARSSLIRIASVPTFRNNMSYRWALEGSFFQVDEDILSETNANLVEDLNPFICSANFAMLYTPYFGNIGNGTAEFRFYTSIGMDMSTYVPAHINPNNNNTMDNVGNTTGYGPEIGAGFIINVGDLSLYSYGTVASGDIVEAPDYRYNSMTANAGVRIGDAVNMRYTMGRSSWAPNERKVASFSRFTVGILLDSLNRN